MKNKKTILWIALLIMVIIPVYAQQYDSEKDFQIDWDDNVKNGVIITKYIGTKKEVRIPPSIQNNTVTGIGEKAFWECTSLTSITIPNSVTSIGGWAFSECTSLTSITIPNSVTSIGDGAFSECTSLTSVTIPNSVTSIERAAFQSCTSLTSVTIPNSVTSIGDGAFGHCTSLLSITIPNSVTSIGGRAFQLCTSLTRVTIPDSVTSIEESIFLHCTSLTSVTIGNSVTSIFPIFHGCKNLTTINVNSGNTNYSSDQGILYNKNKTTLIKYPPKKAGAAFTIPNSVTRIDKIAFEGCTSLTSVTIPNSVTSIGEYAFSGCNITNITIPNSVTSIGYSAFYYDYGSGSDSLTSVTFQGTITADNLGSKYDENFFKSPFRGDLRDKYLARDGGPGTYKRLAGGTSWRKQ